MGKQKAMQASEKKDSLKKNEKDHWTGSVE